jgi:MFS family permease
VIKSSENSILFTAAINAWLTNGTGSGDSQPKGIVPASTEGVDGNGTAFAWTMLVDLIHSVPSQYRNALCRFMLNDTSMKAIKKMVDGQWVAMKAADLIPAILIIQIVAIFGAMLMARLSKRYGNMQVLLAVVMLWVGICIAAYFTYTNIQFYILAVCVGLVMGGIQSLSRSTYSKLLPAGTHDTASFFSLYDVMEKMSIVLGMFSFAFIEHWLESMRYSILALIVFFIIGMILLIMAIRKRDILPLTE